MRREIEKRRMQRRMKGKDESRRECKESGETETRDKTRERRREQCAMMALFIRCVHAQLLVHIHKNDYV